MSMFRSRHGLVLGQPKDSSHKGKVWTEQQKETLLRMYNEGATLEQIAIAITRTPLGCIRQLWLYGLRVDGRKPRVSKNEAYQRILTEAIPAVTYCYHGHRDPDVCPDCERQQRFQYAHLFSKSALSEDEPSETDRIIAILQGTGSTSHTCASTLDS